MIDLGGDARWIGWDTNSEIAAAQYDLIVAFAAGKKASENDRYPRPGLRSSGETKSELFAPTIADFNVGAFMEQIKS